MAMLFLVCTIVRYTDEITMFVDLPTEKEDSIEPIVDFNKPLEMKVRNIKDKHAIMKQNLEKEVSTARLSDMAKILKFNSDVGLLGCFETQPCFLASPNEECIWNYGHLSNMPQ
jgi:hypothetical protein